jgi:hypothetical protein
MIRSIWTALFLLFAGAAPSLAASEGFTVTTCGSMPNAYTAGGFNAFAVDINGNTCIIGTITTTPATPAAGTAGAGYPPGATPITASATGTTAGATATLAAAAGKFTYICGLSVAPGSATAPITINTTVTGPSTTFTESVGAPITAAGTTGVAFTRNFTPCVPGSAVNTAIAVAAGALGTGGVNQDVNAWGFQQ